uniref:Uncharacterized protein n=1 Tax=Poecilia latipinna TaxID=48699 RepID=A0A3B3V0X4_9TELE
MATSSWKQTVVTVWFSVFRSNRGYRHLDLDLQSNSPRRKRKTRQKKYVAYIVFGFIPNLRFVLLQIQTRINNETYLRAHPEVDEIIGDFLRLVYFSLFYQKVIIKVSNALNLSAFTAQKKSHK